MSLSLDITIKCAECGAAIEIERDDIDVHGGVSIEIIPKCECMDNEE